MPLPIVYEDRALIVINKPAHLPTSGRSLDDPACAQYQLATELGEHVWAVHQIDAGTTGLNLFVRRKSAVATFVHKLKQGQKHYLALVQGAVAWSERVIDDPLGWSEARHCWSVMPDGKSARSEAQRLSEASDASLVSVRILTGRTHQVRLHMAHVGHPLLGDARYGGPVEGAWDGELLRPMLHSHRLLIDGVPELRAPIPADLVRVAAVLGLSLPPFAPQEAV